MPPRQRRSSNNTGRNEQLRKSSGGKKRQGGRENEKQGRAPQGRSAQRTDKNKQTKHTHTNGRGDN
eukprot:3868445-Pyramimonas_sp.AAC.1